MGDYDNQRVSDKRPALDGDDGIVGLNSHTHPRMLTPGTLAGLRNGRLEADGMVVTRPGLTWWPSPKFYTPTDGLTQIASAFYYDTPQKEALLCWIQKTGTPRSYLMPMGADGVWTPGTVWTQPGGATPDGPLPPIGSPPSNQNWREQEMMHAAPNQVQWAQLVNRAYLAGGFIGDAAAHAATRDGITTGQFYLWSFWWNGTGWERKPIVTPQSFQHLTSLRGRLFAAPGRGSAERESVYASDVLDGETWTIGNSAVIGEGEGDPIMGLARYDDRLLCVVKERSVYLVDTSAVNFGDPASPAIVAADWVIQKVASGTGCVAPRTVCEAEGDVYWLSRQGLMGVRRVLESGRTEAATDLGMPIRDLLARVNWPVIEHTACAAYHAGRIYLALPLDGQAVANCLAVFHVARQQWEGVWDFAPDIDYPHYDPSGPLTGPTADVVIRGLAVSWFGGVETLHACGWTIYEFADALTADLPEGYSGAAVRTEVVTRAYDHRRPQDEKRGHTLELTFWKSECDAVDVALVRDGQAEQTVVTGLRTHTTAQTPIQTPFQTVAQAALRRKYHLGGKGVWREAQVVIRQTGLGRLRVRSVMLDATARKSRTTH